MEAIREVRKAKGQRITIELPKRFRGAQVEIIVLPFPGKRQANGDKMEFLLLSESALKKDWNRQEEDRAWESL